MVLSAKTYILCMFQPSLSHYNVDCLLAEHIDDLLAYPSGLAAARAGQSDTAFRASCTISICGSATAFEYRTHESCASHTLDVI